MTKAITLGGFDCNSLGIDVLVAIQASAHAPDLAFDVEHFRYNKETDTYTCPANETLTTNGNWYAKKRKSISQMKHYKTSACLSCKLFKNALKMPKADSLNALNTPI
jgi:hypothetical protein